MLFIATQALFGSICHYLFTSENTLTPVDLAAIACYTGVMTLLAIVKYPSRVLKTKAKPVTEVTADIAQLLDDMAETMYAAPGVGLAAPQVNVSLRCIVVDTGIKEADGSVTSNLLQLVNPEVTKAEGKIEWEEGCLSIPEFTLKMKRAANVHVRALDRHGKPIEFDAEGLLAVAVQHEIDHLDGKLLIDNVSGLKRDMYVKELKKKKAGDKGPVYL